MGDIAEAPSHESQITGRGDSRVGTEAELGFAVSHWVVDSQRLFEMRPRPREIALEEERQSQQAMRDRRLRQTRLLFRVAQKAFGRLPRRRELAAKHTASELYNIGCV
jgi:hypothetical protein